MASNFSSHAVEAQDGLGQSRGVPRPIRPHPKPERKPTKIRAWRVHRKRTLEQLAGDVALIGYEVSDGQLSRVERGEQPYNQDLIEALSRALQCTPAQLLDSDPPVGPRDPDIDALTPGEKRQVVAFIRAVRTGTES